MGGGGVFVCVCVCLFFCWGGGSDYILKYIFVLAIDTSHSNPYRKVGQSMCQMCTNRCDQIILIVEESTILPARSDSDFMFCLHSYQGLIIDRSLVF